MRPEISRTPHTFPVFDEAVVRDSGATLFYWGDVVGMLDSRGRLGRSLPGPQAGLNDWKHLQLRRVPVCDISADSVKLPLANTEKKVQRLPWLGVSCVLHLLLIGLFVLFRVMGWSGLSRISDSEMVPVELVFGVGEDFRATAPSQIHVGESQIDLEALKAPETLPQLPKTLAVDAPEKAPDTMPDLATPVPAPTQRAAVEATPEPGTKAMKPEEIAKRVERETRKVGSENRLGTHSSPGQGVKISASEIPADPFATQGTNTALPAGDLGGSLSAAARSYKTIAASYMKRQWSLPDVVNFDTALVCRAEVMLNLFGKVLSVKIVKPSGDKAFDDQVVQTVERASPFPDFASEGLPSRTLVLDFRPRDVK